MKSSITIAFVFAAATAAFGQTVKIYVEPQEGFESYLSAAIVKKHVPAVVTQDKENATFVLTSAVLAKEESTGSKVARCLFAYCAGIQGTQSATVQLINVKTKEVAWAYNVIKGSASAYQSTAEAAAKHLKKYLEEHPVKEVADLVKQPPAVTASKASDPPPPPAPPVEITPGMTVAQVQSALGQPAKVTRFGGKEIQVFTNVKVTFLDGKVTDVE